MWAPAEKAAAAPARRWGERECRRACAARAARWRPRAGGVAQFRAGALGARRRPRRAEARSLRRRGGRRGHSRDREGRDACSLRAHAHGGWPRTRHVACPAWAGPWLGTAGFPHALPRAMAPVSECRRERVSPATPLPRQDSPLPPPARARVSGRGLWKRPLSRPSPEASPLPSALLRGAPVPRPQLPRA